MNMQQEMNQIVVNAKADYKAGRITMQELLDITRIPLKDLFLTIHDTGRQYIAFADEIHVPYFSREEAAK